MEGLLDTPPTCTRAVKSAVYIAKAIMTTPLKDDARMRTLVNILGSPVLQVRLIQSLAL